MKINCSMVFSRKTIKFMGLSSCEPETPGNSKKPDSEESLCLTFVSLGESTIALIKEGEPFEITLEYSVDGEVWEPYTIGETLALADGGELMFRAGEDGNDRFSAGYADYYRFVISGKVNSKGNVMSLLDRDCKADSAPEAGFIYLFANCDGLVSAPVLPAKNLAAGCYLAMFAGCTSLTKAPALPATELAESCYSNMFYGCASLNYVKALFTDEPSDGTTYCWFFDVSPTGTFIKSKDATWDVRGSNGIPEGWTIRCNPVQ